MRPRSVSHKSANDPDESNSSAGFEAATIGRAVPQLSRLVELVVVVGQ